MRSLHGLFGSPTDLWRCESAPNGGTHDLSLRRVAHLAHGWTLVYGALSGPGFDGLDLVVLVDPTCSIVNILYADLSGGSAILARYLAHPDGGSVYVGRDWFHARSCFARFVITAGGAHRDESFEQASRLAHILLRRAINADTGGETEVGFDEAGRFAVRLHEHDRNTPVIVTVAFAEDQRELIVDRHAGAAAGHAPPTSRGGATRRIWRFPKPAR